MLVYVVVENDFKFSDEFYFYQDPLDDTILSPQAIFLSRQEAEEHARWVLHQHVRLHGASWLTSTHAFHWLCAAWDQRQSMDPAGVQSSSEEVVFEVFARWGTHIADFDGQVPDHATPEDLDIVLAEFDVQEYVVLEIDIEPQQLQAETIDILKKLEIKKKQDPRCELDALEQAAVCEVAFWFRKLTWYNGGQSLWM